MNCGYGVLFGRGPAVSGSLSRQPNFSSGGYRNLGPVNTIRTAATGANFFEFEERGVTNTGCLLATSDDEIGKIGPVPLGCGENRP